MDSAINGTTFASNFINIAAYNLSSTVSPEASTTVYENRSAKALRRTIYYSLHGVVGLAITLFNGVVIAAYIKREKLRRQISMVMLTLFVFCFIHGLFVGIIYPLQRVYRYKMSSSMCILTTLLMDFADNYILVLLPVFSTERLLHLKYPSMTARSLRIWSITSISLSVVVTMCYTWLPLIPDLNIPMAKQWSHDNEGNHTIHFIVI